MRIAVTIKIAPLIVALALATGICSAGAAFAAEHEAEGFLVTILPGEELPPWSPPEGTRAKYRYRYYPRHEVYFDQERNLYFFFDNGRWQEAVRLPRKLMLTSRQYEWLYMNSAQPWRYHSWVERFYEGGFKRYYDPDYRYFHLDRDERFRQERLRRERFKEREMDLKLRHQKRYWRDHRRHIDDNDDLRRQWLDENRQRYED